MRGDGKSNNNRKFHFHIIKDAIEKDLTQDANAGPPESYSLLLDK